MSKGASYYVTLHSTVLYYIHTGHAPNAHHNKYLSLYIVLGNQRGSARLLLLVRSRPSFILTRSRICHARIAAQLSPNRVVRLCSGPSCACFPLEGGEGYTIMPGSALGPLQITSLPGEFKVNPTTPITPSGDTRIY